MATRHRSKTSRNAPPVAGNQRGETSGAIDAGEREVARAVLRSGFDPTSFEQHQPGDEDVTQKATFVGEQLVYKDRESRIAEAAYLRAQRRGFAPGCELDDWLAAEKEVDQLLSSEALDPR